MILGFFFFFFFLGKFRQDGIARPPSFNKLMWADDLQNKSRVNQCQHVMFRHDLKRRIGRVGFYYPTVAALYLDLESCFSLPTSALKR